MKTEQEQIDKMTNFIHIAIHEKCLLNNGGHCIDCDYNTDEKCQNRLVAKELFEAGYGDVSEYKAEIERLKEENKKLLDIGKTQDRLLDKLFDDTKRSKAEVKQAQIDVLKELKERAIGYTFLGEKLATEADIDELIKEIENNNTK